MRTLPVLLVLLAVALPATAQPVERCPYQECAIRIENRLLSAPQIVRGPVGAEETVGTLGFFGGDFEDVVSAVPAALPYAEEYARSNRNAVIAGLVGGVLYSVAFWPDTGLGDDVRFGASLGALGAVGYGIAAQLGAQRAQARALWEYNQAFAE